MGASLGRLVELFVLLAVTLIVESFLIYLARESVVSPAPPVNMALIKIRQISSGRSSADHARALIFEAPGKPPIIFRLAGSELDYSSRMDHGHCIDRGVRSHLWAERQAAWNDKDQRESAQQSLLNIYNVRLAQLPKASGQNDWLVSYQPKEVPVGTLLTVVFSPCSLLNRPENLTLPAEWKLAPLTWPHPVIVERTEYGQGLRQTSELRTFNNHEPDSRLRDGVWLKSCTNDRSYLMAWGLTL